MSELEPRLPAIFLGHGSPMEALGGPYADAWRRLGATLPRPRAVLMISAHWYIDATAVTAMKAPRTIHDFYGFPEALYQITYPAPGEPWLAERATNLLAPVEVLKDNDWGLDHGAWSVLRHLIPAANVPVVQLSIDRTKPPGFHFEIGRRLRDLRDEGVLIAGSGDVVHNLRTVSFDDGAQPYDWAIRFNDVVRQAIADHDWQRLINYAELGQDALKSIPTPEHYLPLLYTLGAAYDDEPVSFFNDEIAFKSISMLGVSIGHAQPGGDAVTRHPNWPRPRKVAE
ncbi:MAG TPA: 4,5-DOPA dioxygenase extradiol [Steroidobacteraceae bacterium]|jgi:4,5-DOPA dioxygenase extradiol|nr:4,5-DOPA dioxygenase extradiol [Steroidobacteraceae bacterium]